jgi:hypothetical protein
MQALKVSFAPSSIERLPPSLPPRVPVTLPKLLVESKFVPGLSKCGVFVKLNASARNSKPSRSVILNRRNSEASKLNKPGPLNTRRAMFPTRQLGPGQLGPGQLGA